MAGSQQRERELQVQIWRTVESQGIDTGDGPGRDMILSSILPREARSREAILRNNLYEESAGGGQWQRTVVGKQPPCGRQESSIRYGMIRS